ncbi:MAG: hypothetical protein ACK5F6_04625, partial [Bacteroidota bacterium]
YRSINGNFYFFRTNAFFWSATEFDDGTAWYRLLYDNNGIIDRYTDFHKTFGASVRCLKNSL